MSIFRAMLTACIDHVLAPECAFDRHSDGYCEEPSTAADLGQMSLLDEATWENNWGTSIDYSEPLGVGGFEY